MPPEKRKRPFHRPRKLGKRTTPRGEHVAVMPAECLAALDLKPGQTAVDCTLGGGGHAELMLRAIGETGQLVAFDLDPANLPAAATRLGAVGPNFALRHGNFAGLPQALAELGVGEVHGVLADLGMSSMQVDDRARGFSFMRDGPLDMRMDPSRGVTAAELLASWTEEELAQAFAELGDEPQAQAIAAAICERRGRAAFETTLDLRAVIEWAAPVEVLRGPGRMPARKQQLLPATRVFQALRISVNRELASLAALLRAVPYVLAPGGTVAILSFHSGEDRLVKTAFRAGLDSGTYAEISETALRPSEEEKLANPRGRSAKLRWARTPA